MVSSSHTESGSRRFGEGTGSCVREQAEHTESELYLLSGHAQRAQRRTCSADIVASLGPLATQMESTTPDVPQAIRRQDASRSVWRDEVARPVHCAFLRRRRL